MSTGTRHAYLGLDVGGTNVKYGLVDADGEMLWGARVSTPATRPLPIDAISDIATLALDRAIHAGHDVVGLGVAAPGRVDPGTGVIIEASNLQWKEAQLGPALEKRLGRPVGVLNDTNAAALGEYISDGTASPRASLICVSIGTGVGAGLVMDGSLYTGQNFAAGELGHVVAVIDGRECACGGTGCLETIASGPGIMRAYLDLLAQAGMSTGANAVTLPGVAAAALAGQEAAVAALAAAATALGVQVANCSTLLDISDFVIGGGVANIAWPLVAEIQQAAIRNLAAGKRARLRVRKSTMIDRAAIVGAVTYLREFICA
jgi:glucokinase